MSIIQPYQRTIARKVSCTGVGVHSGDNVTLQIHPAPENHGIVFQRTDIQGVDNKVYARWDKVVDTMLCTRIANESGVTIGTIEHLMAALYACGIDNALISVSNMELPIMDGSSQPFLNMIRKVGIKKQEAYRKYIKIMKPMHIEKNGIHASLLPYDGLKIDFEFDFRGKALFPTQSQAYTVDCDNFDVLFAPARTFGILEDVNKLWEAGLAKGGSLDNAVVISGDRILNDGGLRFSDEFVRHKILDAVGDLYLAGPVLGHFIGHNAGHGLNNLLLKELFADKASWQNVTFDVGAQQNVSQVSLNKVAFAAV